MEAHDGRTRLHGAGSRPLVVAFANPKKIRPGEPPEPAIAPRKLFVGQVLHAMMPRACRVSTSALHTTVRALAATCQ